MSYRKTNPSKNTYYWRAVKRLAERKGISISRARKLDWQKEANAERKRRSEATLQRKPLRRKKVPRKVVADVPGRGRGTGAIQHGTSARGGRTRTKSVPADVPRRQLKLRDYDQITRQDEEEFEDDAFYQEQWETDFQDEWGELDDLDRLEGFMQDFEYEDSDKYKEPA